MKRIRIINYSLKRENDGSVVQLCTCGEAKGVLPVRRTAQLFCGAHAAGERVCWVAYLVNNRILWNTQEFTIPSKNICMFIP
jgi:hypothetical protein